MDARATNELEVFLDVQQAGAREDAPPTLRGTSGNARSGSGSLGWRLARAGLLCGVAGAACLLASASLRAGRGGAGPAGSSLKSPVGLATITVNDKEADFAELLGGELSSANAVVEPHLKSLVSVLARGGARLRKTVKQQMRYVTSVETNTSNATAARLAALQQLRSRTQAEQGMNTHDGNVCADDEELLDNLCYKTCRALTGGKYPMRTTAFTCCLTRPCGIFNQKMNLKVCGGFDVAGDSHGNACPHVPGACLANEELHLGRCYKKCSLLTNLSFPFRTAAATCCKINSEVLCVDPPLIRISPDFNVGGGNNESDRGSPEGAHWPIPMLTEAQPEDGLENKTNKTEDAEWHHVRA